MEGSSDGQHMEGKHIEEEGRRGEIKEIKSKEESES